MVILGALSYSPRFQPWGCHKHGPNNGFKRLAIFIVNNRNGWKAYIILTHG